MFIFAPIEISTLTGGKELHNRNATPAVTSQRSKVNNHAFLMGSTFVTSPSLLMYNKLGNGIPIV